MTETNYINNFMTKLTSFAQKYSVHIFLVAHPTKLQRDKATKKIEIPNLYSIAGSANFYNQTDNGFIVHRDRETGLVDIYIEKIRFSEQGQEGFVSFRFDTMTRQYDYVTSSRPVNYQPISAPIVVEDGVQLEIDEQPF